LNFLSFLLCFYTMINFYAFLLIVALGDYTVHSTLSGWVNDWDGDMQWSAGSNRMITGLYSVHSNGREDRRWRFYHGSINKVHCESPYWTEPLNSEDQAISASCLHNEAVSGFKSKYSNRKEDRVWYLQCCSLTNVALKDMGLSGYLNDWDAVLDFRCEDNEVLTGVYSVHSNAHEDRRWAARCASLVRTHGLVLQSTWSPWMNTWDGWIYFTAGKNMIVTGFSSVHDNGKEDRRWKFCSGSVKGVQCKPQSWSKWVNTWDSVLSFTCPRNEALYAVTSQHHNGKEDRRWKFQCCKVSSNFALKKEAFTRYLNNWDEPIHFFCPSADEVVVGMYSYHDNDVEDRRWKARCAKLVDDLPRIGN